MTYNMQRSLVKREFEGLLVYYTVASSNDRFEGIIKSSYLCSVQNNC